MRDRYCALVSYGKSFQAIVVDRMNRIINVVGRGHPDIINGNVETDITL